jgi:hypothetical protein
MTRATLAANWAPDFVKTDAQGLPDPTGGGTDWNFQALLALFYPSVTGIMVTSRIRLPVRAASAIKKLRIVRDFGWEMSSTPAGFPRHD